MRTQLLAAAAAVAFASGLSPPAHAVLMLSANVNGTTITCADGAACDTNLNPGQLAIADQTVNGVEFLGSAQTQTIGSTNSLDTSSFQVINHNLAPATVTLAVSGTNFIGPVAAFSSSGSGTWKNAVGSSIAISYFGDAANAQGANNPTDLPGLLLDSFANSPTLNPDSFSHTGSGAFVAASLNSMSLGTVGTLAAWDGIVTHEPSLVGRSQAILTEVTGVSEPGTLGLLGAGLIGLWGIGRRRNRYAGASTA